MKRFHFSKIIGIMILVCAGILVFSGIVMLLWNALMPVIFHLPLITLGQALGLLLLTKILFSGFRGPGFSRGFRGGRGPWKEKMKQQWMNMTPEEREKFKQNWSDRCRSPFESRRTFSQERNVSPEGSRASEGSPATEESRASERPPYHGGASTPQ
jgi:Ca2+/H+ antiporter, TMEM165/GDT1 family